MYQSMIFYHLWNVSEKLKEKEKLVKNREDCKLLFLFPIVCIILDIITYLTYVLTYLITYIIRKMNDHKAHPKQGFTCRL